ncbi:MAG TPA: HAD-IB family phosphatase [Thermoanaerobaculia bacterium]|jgi:phosphoserine phosphatase|nr:HAD-IB family phosphatase [Thermoanaerobaculia bacterium]
MTYRLIFFDVDSTLVTIEGIDVLGNGAPEIKALTDAAMNGLIPLDHVYARRLDIIKPTRGDVEKLGAAYVQSIVSGAKETIATLQSEGAAVHLITGGIEQAILPLAQSLAVPERNVHAVRLRFAANGAYEDFDRRSFLARPGGKELVVRDIRARSHGKAAFVGDGVSDLEAKDAVDLFIGFGGVVVRPLVKENAHIFVTTFRDILQQLS